MSKAKRAGKTDLYLPGIVYGGTFSNIRRHGREILADLTQMDPDSPRGAGEGAFVTSVPGDPAWESLECSIGMTIEGQIAFGDYCRHGTPIRQIVAFTYVHHD